MVAIVCSAVTGCPTTAWRERTTPVIGARSDKRGAAPRTRADGSGAFARRPRLGFERVGLGLRGDDLLLRTRGRDVSSASSRVEFARADAARAASDCAADESSPASGARTTARTSPALTFAPSCARTCSRRPAIRAATCALRSGSAAISPGSSSEADNADRVTRSVLMPAAAITSGVRRTRLGIPSCSSSSVCTVLGFESSVARRRFAAARHRECDDQECRDELHGAPRSSGRPETRASSTEPRHSCRRAST